MIIAYELPSLTSQIGLTTATAMAAKKEVVFTKFFDRSNRSMSLRPFCVARDMPFIRQWAWNISRVSDVVASSYLYTSASDFARSFMVLVNNRIPLCQVDICHAAKDELYETYRSAPGDFIIRFVLSTHKQKIRPLHVQALQTCIDYFFSFTEVKQLVAAPDAGNTLYSELLLKAGFRPREKIYNQYSVSTVFVCPRPFML